MPTLSELQSALVKADAAGDTQSAKVLADYIRSQMAKSTEAADRQRAQDRETYAPTIGMSGSEKFLAGVGKAFSDVGTGVSQLANPLIDAALGTKRTDQGRKSVAESRRLDEPLMNTGAGFSGNLVGNIAANAPTAFIPGANTVIGAGMIGAGMGLAQPSTSGAETLSNIGMGGVGGAAVPALFTGAKVAKSLAEPFYEGGRNKIIGRALQQAAGNDAASVAANLRSAGELVPGSLPTVAEAAQNPGIAALQRAATAIDPISVNAMSARQAANNAARVDALREMAGQGGARDFYKASRDTAANQLYSAARKEGFDPAVLTPEAQANIAAFMQRMPDEVINEAQKLAKITGEPITDAGSVNGLHWLKKGLDSLIGKEAGPNGSKDLLRAYTGLKSDLMEGIGNLSPKYAEANQTFAAMSKPINQMDIAQELLTKSLRPIDEQLLPGSYAKNLGDALAQKVTGIRSNTLEKVMTPEQLGTLGNIKEDLARKLFSENAGRGVGSDTVQKLAFSNMLNQAGVPEMVRAFGPAGIIGNVAQRVGQVAYGDANKRLSSRLAEALMNPQESADLMGLGMVTPEMQRLIEGLRRGGGAIGMTYPALANATASGETP